MNATEQQTEEYAEAVQAADDLTIANAKLKKDIEAQRVEIAQLNFKIKNLEDERTQILGEAGVLTFKRLSADRDSLLAQKRDQDTVIYNILNCIPEKFKD